jgi:hypothetical protein
MQTFTVAILHVQYMKVGYLLNKNKTNLDKTLLGPYFAKRYCIKFPYENKWGVKAFFTKYLVLFPKIVKYLCLFKQTHITFVT